jgi:hypothetical protein
MLQPFSLAVAKIETFFQNISLLEGQPMTFGGIGTASFYESNFDLFLVTNWHNITGVRTDNLEPIHTKKLLPNIVRIYYKQWVDGQSIIRSAHTDLRLYENGTPIWLEHVTRHMVDVVAIPVSKNIFVDFANTPINAVGQEKRLEAHAGMDCFALGFPEGIIGAANTPIWKRGSIASEPYQDVPYLIDSATRKGMSGAPIIAQHTGIFGMTGNKMTGLEIIGTVRKFIAIYSGRMGDDKFGYQLGRAWRAEVIEEIISTKLPGKHPLSFP